MKRITLREATEEQIINAVKNNPELFGFNIPQTGRLINADLNGALNILRKEIPNAFSGYGIEVCSTPIVLTIK